MRAGVRTLLAFKGFVIGLFVAGVAIGAVGIYLVVTQASKSSGEMSFEDVRPLSWWILGVGLGNLALLWIISWTVRMVDEKPLRRRRRGQSEA